jgi:hypothetical protein
MDESLQPVSLSATSSPSRTIYGSRTVKIQMADTAEAAQRSRVPELQGHLVERSIIGEHDCYGMHFVPKEVG